jgi:hypothetical protein
MRKSGIKKTASLVGSLLISLYAAELVLSFFPAISSQSTTEILKQLARARGWPFDDRAKWEAVEDQRKSDKNWYPAVGSSNFTVGGSLNISGNQVIPLTGVANANILYCNESGFYTTYASDEFGFHNPAGIWQKTGKVDIAFVGDSFTNGACVRQGEGFVDRIRQLYPQTVNLGAGGNGPLSELAAIKEYLMDRKLGYVFWVYAEENDLSDLFQSEVKQPILMKYVNEEGFSQHLISNRDAINSTMISLLNEQLEDAKSAARSHSSVTHHLLLRNIREALFKLETSYSRPQTATYKLDLFRAILAISKSDVERNGGRLVFVYLPEFARYGSDPDSGKRSGAPMREEVLNLVKSLDIDVIDIDSAFRQLDDAKSVFPFEVHNHYNAGGNMIVACEILRYLSRKDSNVCSK